MWKKFFTLSFSFFLFTAVHAQDDAPQGLKTGTKAPLFEGKDQNGKAVRLTEKLEEGAVVVMFYRGAWCPYCNRQLSELQDSLQMITGKGASVIAVTPATEDNIQQTVKKTDASFSILSDNGLAIMNAYGVTFELDNKTNKKYRLFGIDVDKSNGANRRNLPVPATYVINKEGVITYAFFDPDYKKRASVKEIVNHL